MGPRSVPLCGKTNSASQFEELKNTNIIRVHCLVSRKHDLRIYIFVLNLKRNTERATLTTLLIFSFIKHMLIYFMVKYI